MYALFIKISLFRCMIFDTKKNLYIFGVLKILRKGETRYGKLRKETGASHDTLQSVLKELAQKGFITKTEIPHTGYIIEEKGKKLLKKLEELQEILETE